MKYIFCVVSVFFQSCNSHLIALGEGSLRAQGDLTSCFCRQVTSSSGLDFLLCCRSFFFLLLWYGGHLGKSTRNTMSKVQTFFKCILPHYTLVSMCKINYDILRYMNFSYLQSDAFKLLLSLTCNQLCLSGFDQMAHTGYLTIGW